MSKELEGVKRAMRQREAIGGIIVEEDVAGGDSHFSIRAADRIIAAYIAPLRAEVEEAAYCFEQAREALAKAEAERDRVCELGERRTRERDAAMTKAEALEAVTIPSHGPGHDAANLQVKREGEAWDAGAAAMREACSKVALNACLVPPDGGSPTEDERIVCENAAAAIRSLPLPRRPE